MPEENDPMIRALITELLVFDLSELARSEHDLWSRIARGELSPRQAVAEQLQVGDGDPEHLMRQAELYAPPTPEAHKQALDELIARFFADPSGGRGGGRGGGPDDRPPDSEIHGEGGPQVQGDTSDTSEHGAATARGNAEGERSGERVEPGPAAPIDLGTRRQRRSRVVFGGVLAAAAAAVLVWALVPREGPPLPGESLPGFASEWSNQYTGSMRGAEAPQECQRYQSEGRLEVRLRPESALADDLVIAALARSERGERRWLPIEPTLSASGVITIDQRVDELGLTPGRWTLSFFVSRDDQLGTRELAELSPGERPEVAVVRSDVCIEG